MTDSDVIAVGDQLAERCRALEALRDEKREVLGGFNRRIKAIEQQITELVTAQETKKRKADVEVATEYDPAQHEMCIKRLDTGEIIQRRAQTAEERQPELALVPPEERTATTGQTEEQQLASTPEEAEEMRMARLAAEEAERAKVVDLDAARAEAAAANAEPGQVIDADGYAEEKAPVLLKRPDWSPEPPASEEHPAPPTCEPDDGMPF